jgi:hypothetical protein
MSIRQFDILSRVSTPPLLFDSPPLDISKFRNFDISTKKIGGGKERILEIAGFSTIIRQLLFFQRGKKCGFKALF